MNINMTKKEDGTFIPSYPSDHEKAKKIKVGDERSFTYKKLRSPKFHRLYFALIRLLFENQDQFKDQTVFRKYCEMKSGYYTTTETGEGDLILPQSIAFDKLGEEDFSELYGRVKDFAWERFSYKSEELEKELLNFM